MPNANPILDPSNAFTGVATGAAVAGCRLLKVAAAKADGGALPVSHAGVSDEPVAVSGADAVQDSVVTCYPRQVLRVESSGTIAAGAAVQIGANGTVVTYSSGRKVGIAWEAATSGTFPLVQLQL